MNELDLVLHDLRDEKMVELRVEGREAHDGVLLLLLLLLLRGLVRPEDEVLLEVDLRVRLVARVVLIELREGAGLRAGPGDELLQRAQDVLTWVQSGDLKLHIGLTLPLAEAAEAHRQLEGRETSGKILLTP